MKTEALTDGRTQYTFRQSWLNDADMCAERARAVGAGEMPERETDAAAVGTAVHAGIEHKLVSDVSYYDAFQHALMVFETIEAHPAFVWTKYSHRQAMALIDTYLSHWWSNADPTWVGQPIEVPFDVVLTEDEQRVIRLSGTMDLVTPQGVYDWKTSGRGPYDEWKYRRWAVQPTVYTYAALLLGLLDDVPTPFHYGVMHKDGMQQFTVHRDADDWDWLRRKCHAWADLDEAGLEVWPLNDQHELCSEKWCPLWATCKGRHFS